jgi:hypothetical protein
VNIFNSLDDQIPSREIDVENNIDNCKYIFKHELGSLSLDNNNRELSAMHVNIRSIYKNFDKLQILLSSFKKIPDIICISETNIREGTDNNFIPSIDGYFFIRHDGTSSMGGVGIFVKNNLEYAIRDDLFLDIDDCENIWIEIKLNKKIIVASIVVDQLDRDPVFAFFFFL